MSFLVPKHQHPGTGTFDELGWWIGVLLLTGVMLVIGKIALLLFGV